MDGQFWREVMHNFENEDVSPLFASVLWLFLSTLSPENKCYNVVPCRVWRPMLGHWTSNLATQENLHLWTVNSHLRHSLLRAWHHYLRLCTQCIHFISKLREVPKFVLLGCLMMWPTSRVGLIRTMSGAGKTEMVDVPGTTYLAIRVREG